MSDKEKDVRMKAVIMAGGKGTRIASVNSEVPKPMIPLEGKPVLEYQVECLKRQGIREYIFVTGYLGDRIESWFGDGRRFGISVSYIREEYPLGTAGALYMLRNMPDDDFLLINGDIIFDVDINRFSEAHRRCGGMATILVHPNSHPYDSSLVVAGRDGLVREWLHKEEKRTWYQNRVNAGIHILSSKLFTYLRSKNMLSELCPLDLDRDILKPLIDEKELYAYYSTEYVKDMGTPERYESVCRDIRLGRVAQKNLSRRQKAVFLDRDGTINRHVGFLRNIDDFELLNGVARAIRMINEQGFLVIVVTNQPVIARGEISEVELEEIHRKMETLLGAEGAYVDAVYYCPHHPDAGFPGERKEYKVRCQCRKPEPGLLFQAAQEYNIELTDSWMVGDSGNDILAGIAAGCRTAGVYGCPGGNGTFDDLLEFAEFLSRRET